jgi:hypothetical protein
MSIHVPQGNQRRHAPVLWNIADAPDAHATSEAHAASASAADADADADADRVASTMVL